jgi:hypothetical protein
MTAVAIVAMIKDLMVVSSQDEPEACPTTGSERAKFHSTRNPPKALRQSSPRGTG